MSLRAIDISDLALASRDPVAANYSQLARSDAAIYDFVTPAQPAEYGPAPAKLAVPVRRWLEHKKIKLYTHQSEAVQAALDGKNFVIVTATASGKTLAFNLPTMSILADDPEATALYFYPTKALSEDQLLTLGQMDAELGIGANPAKYDGDVPEKDRPKVRKTSRLVITNPIGWHIYMNSHTSWARFLSNLKVVVIDEAHLYSGTYGSNVAMLMARLRRICSHYGSNPQFFIATATVANPAEHARALAGGDVEVIDRSGAAVAKRYTVVLNSGEGRHSMQAMAAQVVRSVMASDHQTIAFAPTRNFAEQLASGLNSPLVAPYRAVYSPEERRSIEAAIKSGRLRTVVSTNALEVGIDIGSLDAVVICGYPGSRASLRQQAGRVGRSGRSGLVVVILGDDPTSRYLAANPALLFAGTPEAATTSMSNKVLTEGQLLCAAQEIPLSPGEPFLDLLPTAATTLKRLVDNKRLVKEPSGVLCHPRKGPPEAMKFSLNGSGEDNFMLLANGSTLEEMEASRALTSLHEGAIYYHRSRAFRVSGIDTARRVVELYPMANPSYRTEAMRTVGIDPGEVLSEVVTPEFSIKLAEADVKMTLVGYRRIETIGPKKMSKNMPLDPQVYRTPTMAIGIRIPGQEQDILHVFEHLMVKAAPLVATCDPSDVIGSSRGGEIWIADTRRGGSGISEQLLNRFVRLVELSYVIAAKCSCVAGCPDCTLSRGCAEDETVLDKKAAQKALAHLIKAIKPRPNR